MTAEIRRLDELTPKVIQVTRGLGMAGLLAGLLAALFSEPLRDRFFEAYLVNFGFYLSLSLGALFFVILQHLTRSGWSVVIRRLAEAFAATVLPMAIGVIPILIGMGHLYHWTDDGVMAHDALLASKQPFLNQPFFIIRIVLYFAVWIGLSRYYLRRSVTQDGSGDPRLTLRMERLSGPAMVLYGVTLTFASFDLLMSVDPHWVSTIYGVYYFAGSVVGIFALLPVAVYWLQRHGRLTESITVEHYHEMGKLLFAFVVFWAYIAFSQYMLIWYANIPEETGWYLMRQSNGWAGVSLVLLFGHFLVPFLALIAREPKRRRQVLVVGAAWMLLMHWVDIYWLVMPSLRPEQPWPHWLDVTTCLGLGAFFVESAVHRLRDCSLMPERDPRLAESLAFENA